MIWSQSLGLVYHPIPKAACTSVKAALLHAAGVTIPPGRGLHQFCPTYIHLRADTGTLTRDGHPPAGLFGFAVVRHPPDRLVSCYVDKVENKAIGLEPRLRQARSFAEFLTLVEADPDANEHFRPQVAFLPDRLDLVLRFEELAGGWDVVREHARSPLPELPHRNRTTHRPWENYYSPTARRRMERVYQADQRLYESATGPWDAQAALPPVPRPERPAGSQSTSTS